MILPSSLVTREAQLRILSAKNCRLYLRPESMATIVDEIVSHHPSVRTVTAPELHELLRDSPAQPGVYQKPWDDAKDDPWLVFHTSGTTGQSSLDVHEFLSLN